ncbi:CBS domain-containing protein [Alphaproteobacteria bacterium]|nr:CBS domain-containing protein [Alphaproteobacteria bacterium]
MTPFIAKLIERGCVTVNTNSALEKVVDMLVEWRIGTVVVVDDIDMQVLGILSERDIIRHLSDQKTLAGMVAQDLMTAEVITVDQQVTSSELMHLMTKNRIRHVPITKDNKLVGIVSIGDVVKRMLEKYERETELIKQFINS